MSIVTLTFDPSAAPIQTFTFSSYSYYNSVDVVIGTSDVTTSPSTLITSTPTTPTETAVTPNTTIVPSSCVSSASNCTSASSNHKNGAHITSPVAAGIGIGSAALGAIIAALLFFFIRSRRKSSSATYQQHDFAARREDEPRNEKFDVSTTVKNIDHLVAQPTEDDAMISELSMIRDHIKNHVQNYYHTAPVDPKTVDEAGLDGLARVLGISTSAVVGLLLNPATRIPTLRVFLAHLILSRCSGGSDTTQSFLPREVANFAASDFTGQSFAVDSVALFSKWKTISGTLLQQRYSQPPNENDPRQASIDQALEDSKPILSPFVRIDVDTNTRGRNLEGIMRLAAQYAFTMFRQPCSYDFDYTWTGPPDPLVVFPALLITVNHEGQRLSPPWVLSKKASDLGRY
ncbi:hypothetical protein L207DRAFT_639594 [Hyaloscypha variabilis F]|uniref:Uncharacterized protein n=1 Tax=Hyaloscypha variabilis (strain UAMH 11265 / GT02V1 / F) TaxID=1149755 RepID=A0A2J6R4S3_HYAVF|nr:hypothetical protein L207DRAFT_639594 [Hyaloscypha variabilis F]